MQYTLQVTVTIFSHCLTRGNTINLTDFPFRVLIVHIPFSYQFQQTNHPSSSPAPMMQAPPHHQLLDHQQAQQHAQQSQVQPQQNQLLQNQVFVR